MSRRHLLFFQPGYPEATMNVSKLLYFEIVYFIIVNPLPMKTLSLLFLVFGIQACPNPARNNINSEQATSIDMEQNTKYEIATFGGGCFWCTEAIFLELEGVIRVESGYSGGHVDNPTYKEICTGNTGHAEVIQITFDPAKVSFEEVLLVHFTTHDPTTLNRQGNDVGTQYRSVIFYHNEAQKAAAEKAKTRVAPELWEGKPITTQIEPFEKFYKAEDYHQNYLEENPNQPYCVYVVNPKVEKFRKAFKDKLKKHE